MNRNIIFCGSSIKRSFDKKLLKFPLEISVYCGIPAGVEAFRNAREVLKDMNIDTSAMDPGKS